MSCEHNLHKYDLATQENRNGKKSVLIDIGSVVHAVMDDPDDDKFLACAKDAGAKYVVTEDWHLLKLVSWEGIMILTPRDFLRILGY